MRELCIRIRDIFCYCGLTRDEYESVKKEAYISNFNVWKYLHALMILGYAIMTGFSALYGGLAQITLIWLRMLSYSIIAGTCFFTVLQRDSLIAQLIIYLSMILLMLSSIMCSVYQPEMIVSFVVMLVLTPMFMIDRPFYMAILLSSAVAVYLVTARSSLSIDAYRVNRLHVIFYGVLGIIINIFYNVIRTSEFILRKQEKEYIEDQRSANEETKMLNNTLKKMSESVVDLLGDVVEGRDTESGEHIKRVKGFTYILAQQVMTDLPEYGLDEYTVDLITFTSALHDVGKISIPDAILNKPGKLTKEEFDVMKEHSRRGCDIVLKMSDKWSKDYLDMGVSICLNHHEKWDGKGYPGGLKGDEIPIAAQIVSVADVYDALTTKRVYKDAYPLDKAFDMIINGECGAFSDKLMACFRKCREKFEEQARCPAEAPIRNREYEIVSKARPEESFVIGLHDQNRTLREKVRLREEVSVLQSLSEEFMYVCYVDIQNNEVYRYRADESFSKILSGIDENLKSNERFDRLLNTIIVPEDYDDFRAATERYQSLRILRDVGHLTTDFRIRLEDGIHYCRMKITLDPGNANAAIIGISRQDEEHAREMEYLNMQKELEIARREIENREKLADRLAVIDCISSDYDYVCSLNADTMEVVVYRAEAWIRNMFKNLEDIVVSPEIRNTMLRGIVHADDFDRFQQESRHETVLKGLSRDGVYCVNYRAYKYGQLVNYQTRYALDRNNPKRIIIGLHCVPSNADDEGIMAS